MQDRELQEREEDRKRESALREEQRKRDEIRDKEMKEKAAERRKAKAISKGKDKAVDPKYNEPTKIPGSRTRSSHQPRPTSIADEDESNAEVSSAKEAKTCLFKNWPLVQRRL